MWPARSRLVRSQGVFESSLLMFCLASISGIDVLCVHVSLVFFSIWKYSRRLRCHQVFELVIRVNVVTLPVLQRQKF
uniref:Uncharacterized protein n=1 Tax=Mus musculus TaxID=10090 RepID=Q3U488_MOUSE|nr:unnamed protein product [Mus musculus]